MKKKFEYEQTTKIIFGSGRIKELPGLAAGLGNKILLVTGKKKSSREKLYDRITESLRNSGLTVFHFDKVSQNPTTKCVEEGTAIAEKEGCQVVIGLGGGSAMDTAKAIAVAAGATAFSHVNDSGFWLSKSLFEVDEKTNLKTWTVMETIIGIVGVIGATIIWFIVQ